MPVLLVVRVLLVHDLFGFLICHLLRVLALGVRVDELLVDALLDKVRFERVVVDAERDGLFHPYRFPVRERAVDVRSSIVIPRLDLPSGPQLVHFSVVVLVELGVLLLGQVTNPGRPNEDCHDLVAADPAFVFLVREDAPLRDAMHKLLVTEMSLNDQLAAIDPM